MVLPIATLIPIAISLATKFAPGLIGKLAGEKAGKVAEQVIGIASSITGKADPQEAHDAIMNDPAAALEFEKAIMDFQVRMYQEETKRLESINETMRQEAKSEKWWVSGWRPFNGFLFGITLFCDRFVSQIVLSFINAGTIKALAGNPKAAEVVKTLDLLKWDYIDPGVYMMWATVLGVTAGARGFEKVAKTKAANGGNLELMEALKTFGKGIVGK